MESNIDILHKQYYAGASLVCVSPKGRIRNTAIPLSKIKHKRMIGIRIFNENVETICTSFCSSVTILSTRQTSSCIITFYIIKCIGIDHCTNRQ